jgi:hypothetical protein
MPLFCTEEIAPASPSRPTGKTMNITLGRYTCENCGTRFEAPMLNEFAYGEFLLWSANGSAAYLNCFDDKTFDEVGGLVDEHLKETGLSEPAVADAFQKLFGPLACDPDDSGNIFVLGQPPCLECGSSRMASWSMIDPPKIVERDIPAVTHRGWAQLSLSEKVDAVSSGLRQYRMTNPTAKI